MNEIVCVAVSREMGKKTWTYHVKVEGNDVTIITEKSLTLDELKVKIEEKQVVKC